MIPKIIHYCWLSKDPIPESFQKCMDSWKNNLPNYEFIHWDFNRFPRGKSKWVDEAFDNKKYAFAADYIRLYALYNYGGIYLDLDVEVVKNFAPFLDLKTMICWQRGLDNGLEVDAFGAEKNSFWIKHCLDLYKNQTSKKEDGSLDQITLPMRVNRALMNLNYSLYTVDSIEMAKEIESKNVIPIFPYTFFSPKSYISGKIKKTSKTYCIHHFAGSWVTPQEISLLKKIKHFLWNKSGMADMEIKKRFWNIVNHLHKG